jgi:glycosyltransferase involved in cell wall biosynthesis
MISIVIPVFNEEHNIAPLYDKLKGVIDQIKEYEILFIEDGSTDNTYEEIKKINKKNKRIKCIRMRKNFGQTPALLAGFKQAKGDIIVTMDGDLQNDPSDIPRLIKKISEVDVVNGWRYKRKDTFGKKIASKISNWLARKLTGLKIHDFGCTLKAYKSECLIDLELFGEMHRYIPALLAWRGYRVSEIKVNHLPRKHGKSKYGLSRLLNGVLDLINFKFWAGYSTRPLHFFGLAGVILLIAGMCINVYLVALKILYDEALSNRPLLLLGILLMVIGFQIFTIGLLADIMIRSYHITANKKIYSIKEKLE